MAGEIARLVVEDRLHEVRDVFAKAIARSFEVDQERLDRTRQGATTLRTGTEVRRRFDILERLFRTMRGDLGWGLTRTLDTIPHALRVELDGGTWEPDGRKVWIPTDGSF